MKGNKYFNEEDLYDDDYYDDYEEEEVQPKPKKIQQTKPQKTTGLPAKNNAKPNSNLNSKQSTAKDSTTTKNTTQQIKPNVQNQPDNKISIDTLNKHIDKLQINSKVEKPRTIQELNELKYPKINYNFEQEKDNKSNLNLVIIGHVDSGKSTLMGHLLYIQGEVSDKTMQKYEKESKKVGKNTFHFAWAMDEGTEERKRGVTVDIAYKNFETKTKKVNAMDAPGHRDFIPNMITGTSAADAGILVIDSNKNAFEAGFFLGGQTREHAVLARSLGVKQLIVCINKLETSEWSKERFEYIEAQVRDFLNALDYNDKDLFFIPVSGLKGTNLEKVDKSITNLLWYEGKSLIELIDELENPISEIDAPVRFNIADCGQTSINSLQGIGIFGKLLSGVIRDDCEYVIMPGNYKTKIRSMTVNNNKSSIIVAGQSGEILLNIEKSLGDEIRSGNILCGFEYTVPVVKDIRAQIMTLDIKAPINIGQTMFVHCLGQKSVAKIKKIEKIFSKDGKTTKNNSV
jgi:elongation factor 1 alpha-like protein